MNYRVAKKIVERWKLARGRGSDDKSTDFKWNGPGPSYSQAQLQKACLIVGEDFDALMVKAPPPPKKKAAPPPEPKPEPVAPAPEPEPEVKADVGAMEVTVKAGEDGELGTADDEVEIKPKKKAAPKKAAAEPKPKKLSKKTLEAMTLKELKALAKTEKVKGYSGMKKDDLVKALT